jgi:cell division protein FtsN
VALADYHRGVYEPSDDVHVFDGSEDDEDTEGSRLPLLIVIALFVLASFGGVVWLAYQKGVASGRTEPRTLVAESGPAKVPGDNSDGTQTPYKGLKIYEQPAPNESYDGTAVENTAPAGATQDGTVQDNAPPASAGPPLRAAETGQPAHAETKPSKPAPSEAAAAAPPKRTQTVASTAAASTAPAPPPEARTAQDVTIADAAPAAPAAGAYLLQIGSYKSAAEADASWHAFSAKHAALVGGYSSNVKMADLGDKGVWYRLRIGPFSDKASANALCEKIEADGGNCFLAR